MSNHKKLIFILISLLLVSNVFGYCTHIAMTRTLGDCASITIQGSRSDIDYIAGLEDVGTGSYGQDYGSLDYDVDYKASHTIPGSVTIYYDTNDENEITAVNDIINHVNNLPPDPNLPTQTHITSNSEIPTSHLSASNTGGGSSTCTSCPC